MNLRIRLTLIVFALRFPECFAQMLVSERSPINPMPAYLKTVSNFGERADWSLDGKCILFLEKSFGDVFEVELATGKLTPLTHHYFHSGYVRALYLANGDILLSGSRTFDPKNAWKSRGPEQAELWLLKRNLSSPAIPLGVFCKEGPAVSRKNMTIAWTIDDIYTGDIFYENGIPKLINKQTAVTPNDLPGEFKGRNLETQNFRPRNEDELIFNAHRQKEQYVAQVMGINLKTREIKDYSLRPDRYDEPEGIFPDGKHILVESNRHRPVYKDYKSWANIDLYKLALDGSGDIERITFFNDNPEFKATNPVVSDDGKYMAFQYSFTKETTGIGHGILVMDFDKYYKSKKNK